MRHVWSRWSTPVAGVVLLALVLSALAVPALAQPVRHFGPRPGGPLLFVGFGLFFLLRLILVAGLIVLVWRAASHPFWQKADGALRVLRERYARGEIDEDEYRKRLATLA